MEDRQVQIYLPKSYEETSNEFPVLYLLDGQRFFPYGVSLLKSFTQFNQTPDFIIVGISNEYPDRFGHFSDEEKKFQTYIHEDVISFVDSNFRTSNERLIFGWEFGGSFVIQTMIDRPDLFDSYIVASPFPLTNKIAEIDNFLSENLSFDKSLFFSVSPNENQVSVGAKKLDSILKLRAPKTFNWSYLSLENEEHRSTPYSTLYFGIKKYYQFYPELQFSSLGEFADSGGLDYVYDYYEKRALKFGFSKELSDWTMFSLTRNAIRANNYEQFQVLVNEFEKTDFIKRLRVSRSCLIAEFYLQNKAYDKAIDLFNLLVENHPDSERPLKGLVDSYNALNNPQKASYYAKKRDELIANRSK